MNGPCMTIHMHVSVMNSSLGHKLMFHVKRCPVILQVQGCVVKRLIVCHLMKDSIAKDRIMHFSLWHQMLVRAGFRAVDSFEDGVVFEGDWRNIMCVIILVIKFGASDMTIWSCNIEMKLLVMLNDYRSLVVLNYYRSLAVLYNYRSLMVLNNHRNIVVLNNHRSLSVNSFLHS